MKRITEAILTDVGEMTAYFTELGRILTAAEIHAYKDSTPCFQYVLNNVIVVNRCFFNTIALNEPLISKSLLRLQLQNLGYLYAEIKHPLKVIVPVYAKEKDFNKLGLDSFSTYLKELETAYRSYSKTSNLYEIWVGCCKYVHPSALNYLLSNAEYSLSVLETVAPSKQKPEVLKEIRAFQKQAADMNEAHCFLDRCEMVNVNRLIVKLAKQQILLLEKKIKPNKKRFKAYKDFVEGGGKAVYM